MRSLALIFFVMIFAGACGISSTGARKNNEPEVLTIYPDGTMEFRNRIMNEDEVIIYPDGKGGEKAAVRLWTPLRLESRKDSKYYRDTIIVNRIEADSEN